MCAIKASIRQSRSDYAAMLSTSRAVAQTALQHSAFGCVDYVRHLVHDLDDTDVMWTPMEPIITEDRLHFVAHGEQRRYAMRNTSRDKIDAR